MTDPTRWYPELSRQNIVAVEEQYGPLLDVLAEVDAASHRAIHRLTTAAVDDGVDRLVGISLLRRSLTHFTGIRRLLESSSGQPALVLLRSLFETFLSIRYFVFGAAKRSRLAPPTTHRARETRARYFMAASLRGRIYRGQAVLDGAEGAERPRSSAAAKRITEEIAGLVEKLERRFSVQTARFGPLSCFPQGSKKPRYYDRANWYTFGFRAKPEVASFQRLADRLGYLPEYFLIYSPISSLLHSEDEQKDLVLEDGRAEILSPYDASHVPFVAYWAAGWQSMAAHSISSAYLPDTADDLRRVYLKNRPVLSRYEKVATQVVVG